MKAFTADHPRKPAWQVLAPTLVLAIVMGFWVAHETRRELGHLTIDSAVYLSTASSLRHLHAPTASFTSIWDGYSPSEAVQRYGRVPTTVFPPGYAGALAITSVVTGGVRAAARALDVLLVGVNLLLLGWLTARMTAWRSIVAASIPPVVMVLATDLPPRTINIWGFLTLHLSISSDPLFSACFLLALLGLHSALRAPAEQRLPPALYLAGAAAAAAVLTRYIGLALLVPGLVGFGWLDAKYRLRARLERAAIFSVITVAPTLVFLAWGALRGARASQGFQYHHVDGNLRRPLDVFGRYLFPFDWSYTPRTWALIIVVTLVVLGVVTRPTWMAAAWDDDEGEGARLLMQLVLVTIPAYVLLLIASRAFADIRIPIDARLLSPVRGAFYALVVAVAYRALVPLVRQLGAALVLGAVTVAVVAAAWSQPLNPLRHRLIPRENVTSVDAKLADLPRSALVYSSSPDLVYLHAHRAALALPARRVFMTGKANHDYRDEVASVARILNERGGYLDWRIGFDAIVTPEELGRLVRLREVATARNGILKQTLYEAIPANT